jgi:transposase
MAGLTWWNFYFRLFPGSIRSAQVVEFLEHLRRHIPGPLLVVWDGLRTHRSRLVRQYVDDSFGLIHLEYLPAYAPELNPVEYIWGYWKHHELPNVCPRTFGELSFWARRTLRRMRRRPALVEAFWKQSGLFDDVHYIM